MSDSYNNNNNHAECMVGTVHDEEHTLFPCRKRAGLPNLIFVLCCSRFGLWVSLLFCYFLRSTIMPFSSLSIIFSSSFLCVWFFLSLDFPYEEKKKKWSFDDGKWKELTGCRKWGVTSLFSSSRSNNVNARWFLVREKDSFECLAGSMLPIVTMRRRMWPANSHRHLVSLENTWISKCLELFAKVVRLMLTYDV